MSRHMSLAIIAVMIGLASFQTCIAGSRIEKAVDRAAQKCGGK